MSRTYLTMFMKNHVFFFYFPTILKNREVIGNTILKSPTIIPIIIIEVVRQGSPGGLWPW
jgi:hypothetical protein